VHANITRSWWLGTDDNATSSLNSNLLTSNIKFSTKHIYSCIEEVQNENTVIFGECSLFKFKVSWIARQNIYKIARHAKIKE